MPRKTGSFYSPTQGKWPRGSKPCLAISLPSSIYQNRFPSTTMTLLAFLPANLSASVIINVKLDIFSWTRKRTVLPRLNVNAAVWISPAKGWRAAISESLCFFFFFFLEQGSPLAHCQKCFGACSSSWGLSSTLSPFGNEMYRTAEPPHWLFPDWWSLRWKGNPLKGRWWGLKERIPKLKAGMEHMRQTDISWGKSQPQMHFNLELFYFYSYFPTYPMSRGRQELQHPHTNPFDLTNEQNITAKLIRGLTVTECNVPHYPNHCYFPWFRFEAVSIPVCLQRDFHSVLSSYFRCSSQLLKHHTDMGEAKMPMADRT